MGRDSRKENTLPPTEISRQTLGLPDGVKPPTGFMTKTPFVVSPSMSSSEYHFTAFS
jgi:hypothetical protein